MSTRNNYNKQKSNGNKPKEEPSEIMKMVASKVPNSKAVKKVFSDEEIEKIVARVNAGEILNPKENAELTKEYRRLKTMAVAYEEQMQVRNQLIAFPSIKGQGNWYKMIGISALYTAYRICPRIGWNNKVYPDRDNFRKQKYTIGFQKIDEFVKKVEVLEHATVEITLDGIYIFTLPKPISDEDIGGLYRIEEERRERMHNVLRPKAMDVDAYQKILMVIRQMLPKLNSLPKHYFWTTGQKMSEAVMDISAGYFDYADGILTNEEAARKVLCACNVLMSGVSHLSEVGVWRPDSAASVGEVINSLKEKAKKGFNQK